MAELIEETADKLVLRKLIPASREEVFAAWSDPASIRHWMCPGDTTTADAQIDFNEVVDGYGWRAGSCGGRRSRLRLLAQ